VRTVAVHVRMMVVAFEKVEHRDLHKIYLTKIYLKLFLREFKIFLRAPVPARIAVSCKLCPVIQNHVQEITRPVRQKKASAAGRPLFAKLALQAG
jgi:hypothetical protein